MQDSSQIPFRQILGELLNAQGPLSPANVHRLSNLEQAESEWLAQRWGDIPVGRRRQLIANLEELAAENALLCYEPIARIGLRDSDPEVRVISIRMLRDEEVAGLEGILLNMQENDLDERVRAGAGAALGQYIYQGELEEISAEMLRTIEDQLLRTVSGPDTPLVRRKALEALGFSSRPEVVGLIEHAFTSDDDDWVASALFAMGRSADKRWAGDVLSMLDHENASIRLEAARAAGELELKKASARLIEMLEDADADVRAAAIWSLSQIGGEGVAEVLEDLLEENEDGEEAALLESALDNLAFSEGLEAFDLFRFDEQVLNDLIEFEVDEGDFEDEDW